MQGESFLSLIEDFQEDCHHFIEHGKNMDFELKQTRFSSPSIFPYLGDSGWAD